MPNSQIDWLEVTAIVGAICTALALLFGTDLLQKLYVRMRSCLYRKSARLVLSLYEGEEPAVRIDNKSRSTRACNVRLELTGIPVDQHHLWSGRFIEVPDIAPGGIEMVLIPKGLPMLHVYIVARWDGPARSLTTPRMPLAALPSPPEAGRQSGGMIRGGA